MKNTFTSFLIVFLMSFTFGHAQSNGTTSNIIQETPNATLEWRDWVKDKNTSQSDINEELLRLEGIDTYETMAMIGFIYIYSKIEDQEKAFNFSLRAAEEASNALGQYNMGKMYASGFGVDRNTEKAMQWYLKSAENGDVYAQGNLAYAYLYGEGVSENLDKTKYWAKKAANQGSATAMNILGATYVKEGADYFEAVYWYRKAAELGNMTSKNNLGWLYYEGTGVDKDHERAASWFRNAAEQGNTNSQNQLGNMYKKGEGVGQDYSLAYFWYRKAAEQGNKYAQYNLGVLLDKGKGLATNWEKAFKWYKKAADQGHSTSQLYAGEFYYFGVGGVDRDERKAIDMFEKAAEQENKYALRYLKVIADMKNYENKSMISKESSLNDKIVVSYSYKNPYILEGPNQSWTETVDFSLSGSTKIQIWPSSSALGGDNQQDEIWFDGYSPSKTFYSDGEKKVSISSKIAQRDIGYMYVVAATDKTKIALKLPIALCWLPDGFSKGDSSAEARNDKDIKKISAEDKVVNELREHLTYLTLIARDGFAPIRGRQTEKIEGREVSGHYYPQEIKFASSYTIGNSKSYIGRYESLSGAPESHPRLIWGHYIEELRIESLAKFEGMGMLEEYSAQTTLITEYAKLLDKAIPSGFGKGKDTSGYGGKEYTWGECEEDRKGFKIILRSGQDSQFPTLVVLSYDKDCR